MNKKGIYTFFILTVKVIMDNNQNYKCIQEFNVKYSEMDHNLALKPFYLLNFLQDIASYNAEELGFGYTYMSSHNYAWFLIKYRMEFDDYPVNIQNLKIKTRPRGYNKLFAYREFEISNSEKLLGRVFSMWSIVDIQSRQSLLVSNAINENNNMITYQKTENDLQFAKIKPFETSQIIKEFEVRYNDLDVNGHANNGNYIVWAFEPLNIEFKTNHKIKTLDMVFKKEARFGEKITAQISFKDELTSVHIIKNEKNEDLCLVECCWV